MGTWRSTRPAGHNTNAPVHFCRLGPRDATQHVDSHTQVAHFVHASQDVPLLQNRRHLARQLAPPELPPSAIHNRGDAQFLVATQGERFCPFLGSPGRSWRAPDGAREQRWGITGFFKHGTAAREKRL